MTPGSPESARLVFKRAFLSYFLDLTSPVIADPTEAFAASRAYLYLLRERLGAEEFMKRLDDETTHMAGQLEQDLRQRFRDRAPRPAYEELEDRLRECFEHGLRELDVRPSEVPVE